MLTSAEKDRRTVRCPSKVPFQVDADGPVAIDLLIIVALRLDVPEYTRIHPRVIPANAQIYFIRRFSVIQRKEDEDRQHVWQDP